MQVREKHLPTPQLLEFGCFVYPLGRCVYAGACGSVFVISYACAIPGTAFDGNIVAFSDQLRDGRRNKTHPIFFRLDLPWNANQHDPLRLELLIPLPGLWAQIADAKFVAN